MINTTELRIGNWINLHKNVLYEPYSINDGYDLYKLDENDGMDANPIELTEDILLKCGFDKVFELDGYANDSHIIFPLRYDNWSFHPFCTNDEDCHVVIRYLHQLQNLCFALTNTELIINFK